MFKRALCVCVALSVAFCGVALRFCAIAMNQSEYTAMLQSSYVKYAGVRRGDILDVNGERLVNNAEYSAVAVMPNSGGGAAKYLDESQKDKLKSGEAVIAKADSDVDISGCASVKMYERYAVDLAAHIIGYSDGTGHGVCGIEQAFDEYLYGGKVGFRFKRDANGDLLCGITPEVVYEDKAGSVTLTIDRRIQQIAQNAAKKYLKSGAVAVIDNTNGEIRAICSLPCFDRNDLQSSLDSNDTPFINRALCAYSSGSVFKLCTGAAALEYGSTGNHVCVGSEKIGNVVFGCLKRHGNMTLESAIAYSCNSYFIALGQKVGADSLYRMAKLMGFGAQNTLCGGITDDSGTLNDIDDLQRNPAALANFSFGQGQVTTTPLQIASMVQCIANGGKRFVPSLVKSVVDKNGKATEYENGAAVNVMSAKSADVLKNCMIAAVDYGTGKSAKPSSGVCGGKTATAQTGKFDDNGAEYLQAWFAGFIEVRGGSYSIAVMAENGVTGGVSAAPVFREIANGIAAIG